MLPLLPTLSQLRWCHLVNACEVKAHLIGCWQNLGAVCFWQSIPSGLNLVVAAVLRDSLCVVSLLPCVADCCMLYTVYKVEQFVLTIIKRRLLLLYKCITLPVAISMRTHPRLQMSAARPDLSEPIISSGAMNAKHDTYCKLPAATVIKC